MYGMLSTERKGDVMTTRLNLYMIYYTGRSSEMNYDTYDEFIIAAHTVDQANALLDNFENDNLAWKANGTRAIEHIGYALEDAKPDIIDSRFHPA